VRYWVNGLGGSWDTVCPNLLKNYKPSRASFEHFCHLTVIFKFNVTPTMVFGLADSQRGSHPLPDTCGDLAVSH